MEMNMGRHEIGAHTDGNSDAVGMNEIRDVRGRDLQVMNRDLDLIPRLKWMCCSFIENPPSDFLHFVCGVFLIYCHLRKEKRRRQ